ncbi:MAG: hypothetical protein NTZ65_01135 [Candidatus Berkelbacteria bacterium]|nr:hypothetical protein [Candidatus Berkelbacteria bacterium]
MKQDKISRATKMLITFMSEFTSFTMDYTEAFLLSAGSSRRLAQRVHIKDREYYSTMQGLKKCGYIKYVNEDQFLITPKAIKRIQSIQVKSNKQEGDWDGNWKIVVFDIPEPKRNERDCFRYFLKNNNFIGLQDSVFISPFADFEELAKIRQDLGIEEYVSFFTAKSYKTDDDSLLRKRFNLE